MSPAAPTTKTIRMYRVYIKATPRATWDAITDPEWTRKYGYAPLVEYEVRPGGKFRAYPNDEMKGDAPKLAALLAGERESEGAGGGWNELLSGLKTLLETGAPYQ